MFHDASSFVGVGDIGKWNVSSGYVLPRWFPAYLLGLASLFHTFCLNRIILFVVSNSPTCSTVQRNLYHGSVLGIWHGRVRVMIVNCFSVFLFGCLLTVFFLSCLFRR